MAVYMSQYPTPQDAVTAAAVDKVLVVDGAFTITVPLDLTGAGAAGLALIGQGMSTGFDVNDVAALGAINVGQNDVTLQNMRIDVTVCAAAAKAILSTGDRTRIRDVDVVVAAGQTASHGVHLSAGSHHRVENVRIDCTGATVAQVVELGTGNHVVLDKVTTLGGAIAIETGAGDFVEITTCVIRTCTSYPVRVNLGSSHVAVRGCLVDTPGETSELYLQGDDLVVIGNEIFESRIKCGYNARMKVIGNDIHTPNTHGIEIEGCTHASVVGNTVYDAGTDGIHVQVGTTQSCVVGNVVHTAVGDGIQIDASSYIVVADNVVDTAGDNGIESVGVCDRLKVGNNVASTCTTDGVKLSDGTTNSSVTGNIIEDGLTMGAGAGNQHFNNIIV